MNWIVFNDDPIIVQNKTVLWHEHNGLDGYDESNVDRSYEDRRSGKVKRSFVKGKRYSKRRISQINQIVIHHTGGYLPHVAFNTLHNERRLSCQFILGDDGTIYQTLDCKETAWHAGVCNKRSVGIEACLRPNARRFPGAYSKERCERFNLEPHDKIIEQTINGTKYLVFAMPGKQICSLAELCGAIWYGMHAYGNVSSLPCFPRKDGQIDLDYNKNYIKHKGLVLHSNISPRKWDNAGIPDIEAFEEMVQKDLLRRI